jgi:hypothetical protein
VATRALTPLVGIIGLELDPLEAPLANMNCAPASATHTDASQDRHISHAFRFYHLPPLSCISVLLGHRSAPMSCNQAGRPINHKVGTFNGRETATFRTWSKEPCLARVEKTHAYVRNPEDSSCSPPRAGTPFTNPTTTRPTYWEGEGKAGGELAG